ncbi:MAG TPA: HAMP domain-containing sensor histidine kinase, partial [Mobilitalea sp.]|nr:HAMP domain-containing sensor histidine kinase [Mobilitalea sp.]
LYLAFPDEYIQKRQAGWNVIRSELIPIAVSLIQSVIAALICLGYLIAVAGRKAEDDQVHLSPYTDKIFSDIQVGVILSTLFLWFYICGSTLMDNNYQNSNLTADQKISMIVIGVTTGIAAIICMVFLLSLVRKLKARKLFRHTLIFAILSGISNFVRSFFDDSRFEHYPLTKSLNRRQVIFTVSSGLLVFIFFISMFINPIFGLFVIFMEGLIIYWYFNENKKTFEEINLGFQESYKEMMKSEKMKVDLITNVSHDLKTPLTSIISYVELLSKEDLTETARDYVKILAEKSERLKNIVSDLFDLAKSTSGNLPLNLENLDLKKLIEQTLADMEDDIKKTNLRIKTNLTENPVYIYSDGKKLYRVFQNIIGNALKYSLSGTRIFIDMETVNNYVNVTVKNTASYDMDFTAEEILQRFSRGDKSRSTEGSGLGLSIAESFTQACGGTFKVEIDGDQFKVKMGFPISRIVMPSVQTGEHEEAING